MYPQFNVLSPLCRHVTEGGGEKTPLKSNIFGGKALDVKIYIKRRKIHQKTIISHKINNTAAYLPDRRLRSGGQVV